VRRKSRQCAACAEGSIGHRRALLHLSTYSSISLKSVSGDTVLLVQEQVRTPNICWNTGVDSP
jgi:hypothetical protein